MYLKIYTWVWLWGFVFLVQSISNIEKGFELWMFVTYLMSYKVFWSDTLYYPVRVTHAGTKSYPRKTSQAQCLNILKRLVAVMSNRFLALAAQWAVTTRMPTKCQNWYKVRIQFCLYPTYQSTLTIFICIVLFLPHWLPVQELCLNGML